MALRNAFENLAVETTQESIDSHLAAIEGQLDIQLSTLRTAIVTALVDILGAVDGLELTADNISIDASTLNLQTDELESLLTAVRDRLPGALDPRGRLKVADLVPDQRFEWQDVAGENKPLYIGNAPPNSAAGDNVWEIQKYTFAAGPTTGTVVTQIQTRTGSWDGRAALF